MSSLPERPLQPPREPFESESEDEAYERRRQREVDAEPRLDPMTSWPFPKTIKE